jgi:hypothetical protein
MRHITTTTVSRVGYVSVPIILLTIVYVITVTETLEIQWQLWTIIKAHVPLDPL